jgi:DNA polymerase III epsilon subunit-like protein
MLDEFTILPHVHIFSILCGTPEPCQGKNEMMNWNHHPIHVMDFEGCRRTGIVEYGVVVLMEGQIMETATRLCRPLESIDPRESQVHGISNRDVREEDPFESEWITFSGYRRTGPLCAHHAMVEDGLLRQVWPFPGTVPDFLNGEGTVTQEWGPWMDTRRLYEHLFPQLESYQLMELVRLFHLDDSLETLARHYCPSGRRRPHCALYDALASTLLLQQIPRFPGYEQVDLWWFLYNSAPNRQTRADWAQGELFE